MKPTQILSNEHRVIEVVLDCLEQQIMRTRKSRVLGRKTAEQFIDFIRTFADGCHHGKEENHLFSTLVSKGLSREAGPVAVMLQEHDLGRSFVAQMSTNLSAAVDGDEAALGQFLLNAEHYVQLLRAHIVKEDEILFPLADRMLSDADFTQMTADFDRVESHHMGEGTHQRYLDLAKSLAIQFDVAADVLHEETACGCGHKKKATSINESPIA